MISSRIALRLLPALVWLLLAVVPGGADPRPQGILIGIADGPAQVLDLGLLGKADRRHAALTATDLDVDDDVEHRLWIEPRPVFIAASALVIAPVRVEKRIALPAPRDRAAPPTGPPHA